MSHPGNDEITDNARDRIDPQRVVLINKMVHAATEVGIGVVQEIAAATLKRQPGMSVKEFTKVLDEYLVQQKAQANNNG
tara:strand:- start:5 stop:241 length:237 start_codon:yes stop_codon:yes gene_type:complete